MKIGISQPRKIAAINLANRVAYEMNTVMPKPVGYEVRFRKNLSNETRIKFMTEGILLKELLM